MSRGYETQGPLRVQVNDELVLDAGWWEEQTAGEDGEPERRIHPPAKTMFEQVIEYLGAKPQPPDRRQSDIGEQAVAALALCLRWGSYVAVLTDDDKRLWSQAGQAGLSRIADSEMRRINVEASSAFEHWIELMRNEPERHRRLVWLAVRHLPVTLQDVEMAREPSHLLDLATPEMAARLAAAVQPRQLQKARADASLRPTRVLANAMVNFCWRNGAIEDIHAGQASTYPLMQRRIMPSEEQLLMRATAGRLAQGIVAISALLSEDNERSWSEQVLPFGLVPYWLVTPTNWSLKERTCEVWLRGVEPNMGRTSTTPG